MDEKKHFFEREIYSKKKYIFNFKPDMEIIKDILKHKKSGKVLDLGCGEGGNSLFLSKNGFDVTCVEISKTAIKNIKEESIKQNLKLNIIESDIEKFNFNEKYDIIIGAGILHFVTSSHISEFLNNVKIYTNKDGLNIFDFFINNQVTQKNMKNNYSNWKIVLYEEYLDEESNQMGYIIAKNSV